MDKIYNNKIVEEKIYQQWEEKGYFKPQDRFGNKQKYSIILPLPNANAPLHFGHAMFVIEDILTRFHRMRGAKTLWMPGADHAGFETQFVYEKKLQVEGKSRFDFDRETLYKTFGILFKAIVLLWKASCEDWVFRWIGKRVSSH